MDIQGKIFIVVNIALSNWDCVVKIGYPIAQYLPSRYSWIIEFWTIS